MFFVEFLRFLTGYVYFSGSGGFSERFINLCSFYDIPLWKVSHSENSFTACTSAAGYLKITLCARKSGVKTRIIKKSGIPFIMKKLKPRIGLAAGFLFFIFIITVLSGRVWIVEISGNIATPDDVILSAVYQSGLRIGQPTDEISVVTLSLDTCKILDSLSRVSVSVNGCCVYIDVKEGQTKAEIEKIDGEYNIVAAKDAQIVTLECYRGTPQVKKFSSVMKGDIIISGTADNKDETVSLVHASGYVVGRTNTIVSKKTDANLVTLDIALIDKTYAIDFFGIRIPLGKSPDEFSQIFSSTNSLTFKDKVLPVSFTVNKYYKTTKKKKTVSAQVAETVCINKFMNEFAEFSRNKQIIESEISVSRNKHFTEMSGNFTCYENIGKEIPLEAEFNEQDLP